jgi:hypothetical protein
MLTAIKEVNERSTKAFVLKFLDENDDEADMETLVWSLTDISENIINDLEQEVVATPNSPVTILLSGDDLQILAHERGAPQVFRFLVLEGTYNSSTLGNDLPKTEQIMFKINNLKYIT